jgi:hypothetical protein
MAARPYCAVDVASVVGEVSLAASPSAADYGALGWSSSYVGSRSITRMMATYFGESLAELIELCVCIERVFALTNEAGDQLLLLLKTLCETCFVKLLQRSSHWHGPPMPPNLIGSLNALFLNVVPARWLLLKNFASFRGCTPAGRATGDKTRLLQSGDDRLKARRDVLARSDRQRLQDS